MVAIFKIGFYDSYTGIWVEGEKELWVHGWNDMMNTKNRWKRALAEKYGETVEVECKEKNKDEEIVDRIFRLYKSPSISSWTSGEPLPPLEEEEEECFEPGRPVNDIMALNP